MDAKVKVKMRNARIRKQSKNEYNQHFLENQGIDHFPSFQIQGIDQFPSFQIQGIGQFPRFHENVGFIHFLTTRYQEIPRHPYISVSFINLLQCFFSFLSVRLADIDAQQFFMVTIREGSTIVMTLIFYQMTPVVALMFHQSTLSCVVCLTI